MKIEILKTADGSPTLYLPELDETYHSRHGSVQEARHVFIQHGLYYAIQAQKKENPTIANIHILEVGFGTGLNALLTLQEAIQHTDLNIAYTSYETQPVPQEIWSQLNYINEKGAAHVYDNLMQASWNEKITLTTNFDILKIDKGILDLDQAEQFDLIYFDAFGPRAQAEMWDISVFELLHRSLKTNGVLVTYCAMGQFKRDLKSLGFVVESLPGPPGKREMTRAVKA
ncbi:MAG: tRNA (5-methylaminomethyl-2-thiouridine)(34)-methyltransferase MnmD [Flavobacteriales bacterium]